MATHIDAFIDDSSDSSGEIRTAKITRTEKHGAIGVPVFFSAEQLERQGIDPDEFDRIAVRVEDGFILFDPTESEASE